MIYSNCGHAKWQYIAFCHRVMDDIPYSSKSTRTVNPYTYYIMLGRIHFLLSCCMFFFCVCFCETWRHIWCMSSLPNPQFTTLHMNCPTMFSLFLVTTTILVMHVSRPSYRSPLPLCWRLHGRTCSCFYYSYAYMRIRQTQHAGIASYLVKAKNQLQSVLLKTVIKLTLS